jgi:signal transduction histidine kinase
MDEYYPGIGSTISYAFIVSINIFYYYTMNISFHFPRLAKLFWPFIGIVAGIGILSPWLPLTGIIIGFVGILVALWIWSTLWSLYRLNIRAAKSFIIAGIVMLVPGIPVIIQVMGLIETSILSFQMFFAGILGFLILLSLMLAQQTREFREQKEHSEIINRVKDEFLTTMSHELRTPMSSVIAAGTLLKQTDLDFQQQEYVSKQNTAARHLLGLVDNILDLSQMENASFTLNDELFCIQQLLDNLQQILGIQANEKGLLLTLHAHIDLNLHFVGDSKRLSQILLNLLGNALKFTEEGKVALLVWDKTTDPELKHHQLVFEVRDTGIGISKEAQHQIFKPFSQVESHRSRNYGGSGLGLTISKKLVNNMGGDLELNSIYGEGSCFHFTLEFPARTVITPHEKEISNTDFLPTHKPLKDVHILLVDDDDINLFFGGKLLQLLGAEVTHANSGEIAIQHIHQKHIDLIYMDVSMPDMDGYETTRRIRKHTQYAELPIIALTAHAIVGEQERCLSAGMNDYLTKPLELMPLQKMVEKWVHIPKST